MFYNVSYATNVALKSPFKPELGNASFQDLSLRFIENVAALPYYIGEALTFPIRIGMGYLFRLNRIIAPVAFPAESVNWLMVLIAWTMFAGIVLQIRQKRWLLLVYLSLTLAAVCMTSWPGQNLRYLAPVLPFLLLGLFHFVFFFEKWASVVLPRGGLYVGIGVAASLTLLVSIGALLSCDTAIKYFLDPISYEDRQGIKREYRLMHAPAVFSSMDIVMKWLDANADKKDVIGVSMPHWVYLKTGFKTVMPPLEKDPAKAQQMLDSVPVSYLIVESMLMEQQFNQYFAGLALNAPDKWRLVHTEKEVSIYQRSKPPARQSGDLPTTPGKEP
jgi:hypothetical protein